MLGVAATYLGPAERPPAITRMALPRTAVTRSRTASPRHTSFSWRDLPVSRPKMGTPPTNMGGSTDASVATST